MAGQLQLEFERLTNQARFISMIVSKELVVSGRKKADVVTDLRKKDFRPFPRIAKAKAEGETEETVEDEEEEDNGTTNDFDYLLNMSISSLTKERVCILYVRHCIVKNLISFVSISDRQTQETGS